MKVALIGSNGRVAQRHIKAWRELGASLFCCDKDYDWHHFLRTEWLKEPAMDDAPTIVDICTPIYLHAAMIQEADALGYDILCEKPVGLNRHEADEISRLTGKIGIVQQFRFNPKVIKLKKEIEQGKYGEIKLVTATYCRWRGSEYYKDWEADIFKAGGGVVLNVCIHYLDLMQWIFGYPTAISGLTTTAKPGLDVEDNAVGIMRFPSGAVGSIVFSTHVSPPKHFELMVVGTKGHTTIQLRENEYHRQYFEAFIKGEGYVDPLEASKSLRMALAIMGR